MSTELSALAALAEDLLRASLGKEEEETEGGMRLGWRKGVSSSVGLLSGVVAVVVVFVALPVELS